MRWADAVSALSGISAASCRSSTVASSRCSGWRTAASEASGIAIHAGTAR